MQFDLDAITNSASGLLKLPLFVVLLLVVRGAPNLAIYREELRRRDRVSMRSMPAPACR